MLATMRSGAGNIFAKFLLGLLVLSFMIWGIGDIFRANRHAAIAKVGGEPIAAQEFQRHLNRELQGFRRTLGSNYSEDLVKKMGIPEQVLDSMITHLLLKKEAASLHLKLADDAAFASIRSNPVFQSERGEFDKQIFQRGVEAMGISQAEYIDNVKKDEAARQLVSLLNGGAPRLISEQAALQKRERREASILTLSAASLSAEDGVSEQELETFYSEHGELFSAPEMRQLSYVIIDPVVLAASVKPEESAVSAAAEAYQKQAGAAEKRIIQHILFATLPQAQTAYEAIISGKKFSEVAKGADVQNKNNINLGTLAESEVPEGAGQTVFLLKEGAVSKPYQTNFGWHVFKVVKIESGEKTDASALRKKVAMELALQESEAALQKMISEIEDQLAGGSSLEEAVKPHKLQVLNLGPTTKEGPLVRGNKMAADPVMAELVAQGFALAEKETSNVQSAHNLYFIVRVDGITAARLKPLREVRKDVETRLLSSQQSERLKAKAEQVRQALLSGEPANEVAQRHHATLSSSGKLAADAKTLPAPITADIFRTPNGGITQVHSMEANRYAVAAVTSISQTPDGTSTVETAQSSDYAEELFGQYLHALRSDYDVQVDESALKNLGASAEE